MSTNSVPSRSPFRSSFFSDPCSPTATNNTITTTTQNSTTTTTTSTTTSTITPICISLLHPTLPPSSSIRTNQPSLLSSTSPPLIRIVTVNLPDSPSPAAIAFKTAHSVVELLPSSARPQGLRRMSSTGTHLNLAHQPSQSHAYTHTLVGSPLTGNRRSNPFGSQSDPGQTDVLVIGGECGLADGGTSCTDRLPSGKKWIAHHLSAVLQHSFSVSSLHPITSSSPPCSAHYSQTHNRPPMSTSTHISSAEQLRNKASLTSLSSFTESTTTEEEEDDEDGDEVEALSSTSSSESYLIISDPHVPSPVPHPDPDGPATYRPDVALTPRQRSMRPTVYGPQLSSCTRPFLLKLLDTWAFDANSLSPPQIRASLHVMLLTYLNYTPGFIDLLAQYGVSNPQDSLNSLVDNLEVAYDPRNAYHNFRHAVDVVQAVYTILSKQGVVPPLEWVSRLESGEADLDVWQRDPVGRVGSALDEMSVWALLLAAAGHDVGHPGLSNAFMVNARTPISHVFSDGSVLENFHRITFTRMLRDHGFEKLVDGHVGFRRVIAGSVLATDMGRHFPIVEELKALASRWNDENARPSPYEPTLEDTVLITAALLKCGDISNSSRPHRISLTWSSCLLNEWSRQAALETDLHLPVSVVTLDPAEKRAQAKSQIGFTTLFVLPLFSVMESLSPIAFKPFVTSCRLGLKTWQRVVEHIDTHQQAQPLVSSMPSPAPCTSLITRVTSSSKLQHPNASLQDSPPPFYASASTLTAASPPGCLTVPSHPFMFPPTSMHETRPQNMHQPTRTVFHTSAHPNARQPLPQVNDELSPADDDLTPKLAQNDWWASTPPPTNTSSFTSHPSMKIAQPVDLLPSISTSPHYPASTSRRTMPGTFPAQLPTSTDSEAEEEERTVMQSPQFLKDVFNPRHTLTIKVPSTDHPSSLNSGPRSSWACPDRRMNNAVRDDSSFSSVGSPSSPSQSPYFTPGVSSASSVESSNDGSDGRVGSNLAVSSLTSHHLTSGSGLRGLSVGDRLSTVIRTRDKGLSVDLGLERRSLGRSSLPEKKKMYSPYMVNQQVACAKGCGKVTAKCVKCGSASKTKMQRSQSLAKPFFINAGRRNDSDLALEEEPDEVDTPSFRDAERKRMKEKLVQPILPALVASRSPLIFSLHTQAFETEADPSTWPPYPFRPT